MTSQLTAKSEVRFTKKSISTEAASLLKERLPSDLQRAIDLAAEKGASSWLTTLPIEDHRFTLHKSAFRDALALRYNWTPSRLPSTCACGSSHSIEHALSYPKGGLPSIGHNDIRDLTAHLMTEVCNDVCIEPHLQPLTGEHLDYATYIIQEGAHLDIAANGFWGGERFEKSFFDVHIFNPHAPSNRQISLYDVCYKKHERLKKRSYEQRVR